RKRQGGENSKEKGDEPWRCDAFASHLFHGTDESNRLPRVDGMDDRCGFPSDTHRVSAGADQEVDSERGVLSERRIHLVRKFFLESFLLYIPDHSDDREPLLSVGRNAGADGIGLGPVPSRYG